MKKIGILMLVFVSVVFFTAAASGASFMTIVTGSTGGTYYPVGTILANHFNEALGSTDIKWSAQSSGGTAENLEMIKKGEAEMAITMANLTGFAYTGTVTYEGKARIDNLRYVMGLGLT